MAKIMEDLKFVPKDSVNNFQKYSYQGITDIMDALHPLMSKYKVALSPRTVTLDAKSENSYKLVFKQVEFSFVSLEDGSVFEPRPLFEGLGIDNSDKADSKASTFAYKKMLQQVFCISTKDTIDPDGETPTIDDKKQKRPAPVAGHVQPKSSLEEAITEINNAKTIDDLRNICQKYNHLSGNEQFIAMGKAKKEEIQTSEKVDVKDKPSDAVANAINRQTELNLKTA